ncbi:hypothetical protein OG949_41050 (plasmid) [Streptomyces scopuliridis]|nr:hypothetical protein [Streptomyces scopuliridis]WSB39131.1 hypothetical protein OG949_41050 [Streptomyces scopuliridis]
MNVTVHLAWLLQIASEELPGERPPGGPYAATTAFLHAGVRSVKVSSA